MLKWHVQKNYPLPQNDAPDTEEQPIKMAVNGVGTSISVGVTAPVICQTPVSITLLYVVVTPLQLMSIQSPLGLHKLLYETSSLIFFQVSCYSW